MEKGNEFTGFLKNKNVVTKKEVTSGKETETKPKVVKTLSLKEKAVVSVKSLFFKLRKAYQKSSKFAFFLISVMLFIGGPAYVHYMNQQLYNFFKANGGFRREGMGGPGMRPY